MTPRPLIALMLALAVLGAGITTYLTIEHGRGGVPVCVVGHGCEVIARSSYAHLGRIPSAAFGLLGYLLLAGAFVMRLMHPPDNIDRLIVRTTFGMALFGFGVSAFLTYVALIQLQATCIWCLASAIDLTLLASFTGYTVVADVRAPEPAEDESLA